MAAWHFIKHLTLSRPLMRISPSSLSVSVSSSLPFLSKHHHHCSSSSAVLPHKSSSTTYLSVLIRCSKDNADVLGEALLCFGATSVSMDQNDVAQTIDEICITSIYPEDEDINLSISHAFDSIGFKEKPRFEIKAIEEEDWIKRSPESFHPVEITQGLWVVPEWSTPPDVQATNIMLNPGHAFGTGEHATTKLCLLLLHDCITGGECILDYGTGSGILAIAALKFGAAFAVGVDVDAQAIASAYQNTALNNIGPDKIQLQLIASENSLSSEDDQTSGFVEGENTHDIQTITDKDKYDVVIANILLNPLLDNADQIISRAKPGAVIGLSGILYEQVHQIINRYSSFLEGIEVSKMDDWACVSGRKTRSLVVPSQPQW